MIIDSHVHLINFHGDDSIADLVGSARRNGIDIMLASCLGIESYESNPTAETVERLNKFACEKGRTFVDELRLLCYACPSHGTRALEQIERYVANGPMVGIKLLTDRRASHPSVDPIAERAIELDVPIMQHAWYKRTGNAENESTPYDVCLLAARFPRLRIHMAHLYGAGYHGIGEIARYTNIWADISGSEPEAAVMDYALNVLGPRRILYGSDEPGRNFAVQLGKVQGTHMSSAAREAILWRNAKELYKL
jgi:predicted TIM-barrel fold metal-dependent hydrolase